MKNSKQLTILGDVGEEWRKDNFSSNLSVKNMQGTNANCCRCEYVARINENQVIFVLEQGIPIATLCARGYPNNIHRSYSPMSIESGHFPLKAIPNTGDRVVLFSCPKN